MQALKNIPANYQYRKTLDLSGFRIVLWLNLASIPLLFIFGWLFMQLIFIIRSIHPFPKGVFGYLTTISGWDMMALPLSIILMLVMHELIHGIFFWWFTHERPIFALKSGYAFAAAPQWFLPRSQYILVGLSPFVIITIVSILLAWFAVSPLIPYFLMIAAFNAAGSLGDLLVVGWVLSQPKNILVNDKGDVFSSFAPGID